MEDGTAARGQQKEQTGAIGKISLSFTPTPRLWMLIILPYDPLYSTIINKTQNGRKMQKITNDVCGSYLCPQIYLEGYILWMR